MEKRNPCRSTENATCNLTEYACACFSWNSGVTGTGDEIESGSYKKECILGSVATFKLYYYVRDGSSLNRFVVG